MNWNIITSEYRSLPPDENTVAVFGIRNNLTGRFLEKEFYSSAEAAKYIRKQNLTKVFKIEFIGKRRII